MIVFLIPTWRNHKKDRSVKKWVRKSVKWSVVIFIFMEEETIISFFLNDMVPTLVEKE